MGGHMQEFVQSIKNSKNVLVLQQGYQPLLMALWSAALVAVLKRAGKQVTVLVSSELEGWGQRVDAVYPTDMVLNLEQLKQVIAIPFEGDQPGIRDLSYEITKDGLEITVVPTAGELQVAKVNVQEHGHRYDLVFGLGVAASHPLMDKIVAFTPSVSGATAYFAGTYSQKALFQEKLPVIKRVETLSELSAMNMLEVLTSLADPHQFDGEETELMTLLLQQMLRRAEGDVQTQGEIFGKAKGLTTSIEGKRMEAVYMSDFAKQNRVLQQILASAQRYNESSLVMYQLPSQQLQSLGASVDEVIAATSYVPRFFANETHVLVLSETPQRHHVHFEGNVAVANKLARRFGFSVFDVYACGVVESITLEKLRDDVLRIAQGEVLEPTSEQANSQPIIPVPSSPAEQSQPVTVEERAEVAEVSDQDVMPISQHEYSEEELDSGEVLDSGSQEIVPPQTPSVEDSVSVDHSLSAEPESVPVSQGVDFAAIAKKMRESIT